MGRGSRPLAATLMPRTTPLWQHNYEQSLFLRLQKAGLPVRMLTTQYRMHPHISLFPGGKFYRSNLEDAPHLLTDEWSRPWHARRLLAPYVMFDVADGRSEEVSSSWSNDLEAQLALIIVRYLLSTFGEHLSASEIGIIAPYNGQVLPVADAPPPLARAPRKAPSPCPVAPPRAPLRCATSGGCSPRHSARSRRRCSP